MKVSAKIKIDSTKEKIWEMITDIENSANIISSIIKIEILNPTGDNLVGLKRKETRKMFGKEAEEVMWVTHSKMYDYYQTRAESHGSIYLSRLNIIEENNVVTLEMSFEGKASSLLAKMMSGVFGGFMKKSMIKVLEEDLNDIKKACEAM